MKRHALIFLGTFLAGAIITFGARAALHDAHAGHAGTSGVADMTTPVAAAGASMPDHGASHGSHATAEVAPAPAPESAAPTTDASPVNTVCAICGMKVNPRIPTQTYQGKTVGFGCGACPPMFRANPDKYGPAALRNEVVED